MAVTEPLLMWPLVVEDTTYYVRVTCNSVTTRLTFPTLTAGRYYWISTDGEADAESGTGDGEGGVGDYVTLLKTCLETHAEITSVALSTTGTGISRRLRFTFTANAEVTIEWSHSETTVGPGPLGFAASDVTSSSSVLDSPLLPKQWYVPARAFVSDSKDRAEFVGGQGVAANGATRTSRIADVAARRDLLLRYLPLDRSLQDHATATEPHNTFQRAWELGWSKGHPIRVYDDEDNVGSTSGFSAYVFRDLADPLRAMGEPIYWHEAELRLRRQV